MTTGTALDGKSYAEIPHLRWQLAAAIIVSISAHAMAASYWLKSGTADWSAAESFWADQAGTQTASVPPGASDVVFLPAGDTRLSSGTASFSTASSVQRIVPQDGARLVVTVESGEATFGAAFNAGQTSVSSTMPLGEIVKRGAGTLTLAAQDDASVSATRFLYFANITAEAGILKLPQNAKSPHLYYGDASVSNGATLYLPASTQDVYARFRSFCGGESSFVHAAGSKNTNLLLEETSSIKNGTSRRRSVFGGTFSGGKGTIYTSGSMSLTGTASTFASVYVQNGYGAVSSDLNGMIALAKFGGSGSASSIGTGAKLSTGANGGGFRYIGTEDEATGKEMSFNANYPYSNFMDAGPHGGVTFRGPWYLNNGGTAYMNTLLLTGSNTVPCTVAGALNRAAGPALCVRKTGSGAWRLAIDGASTFDAGIKVEEGALQFTSLANAGEPCALGLATNLAEVKNQSYVPAVEDRVPYAYRIGTDDAEKEAVFEYVGAASGFATNRPAVLTGTATFRASGTGKGTIGLTGVSAKDASGATLVLDGTNANQNVVSDISDGAGPVSVVKRGRGTWRIAGDTTFSGRLDVQEGLLEVAGPAYTWYRFTIRTTGSCTSNPGTTVLRQIALYDADGIRQNVGLTYALPTVKDGQNHWLSDGDWLSLAPGSVTLGRAGAHTSSPADQQIGALFTDDPSTEQFAMSWFASNSTANVAFDKDDSSTWMPIVMRLTNGTPEIAAYDYRTYYLGNVSNRWPKLVRFEGSTDGMAWDLLDDRDIDLAPAAKNTNGNRWVSDATAFSANQVRKDKGFVFEKRRPDHLTLPNVSAVSVSAGATLQAVGPVTLSSIHVDCTNCGVLRGFAMNASGTLSITNAPAASFDLPDMLQDVSSADNIANWTLMVDGSDKTAKCSIHVSGNRITIVSCGFRMVLR